MSTDKSADKPIPISTSGFIAPTPQNTPLNAAPIGQGLSKPTVPDITEEDDDDDEEDEDDARAAAIKATMLDMVHGKLQGLIGKSSGYIENLPVPVRRRIEGLKGVQKAYTDIELEYRKELFELDRKYADLYKPVFDRRASILNGQAEPTEEEVKTGFAETQKDDPEAEAIPEVNEKDAKDVEKGVPDFWLTALRNHLEVSELITERDEDALKKLTDIRVSYLDNTEGYVLTFHFAPNAYFTNETLTKTYYYQKELGYTGDFIYDRAEGTKIEWKEDKDLTKTFETRKQRNKNTNRTRIVKKAKKTPSFFDFFSPPVQPTEDEDVDDEEADDLEDRLAADFEMGDELKERIVPRAIDYYTGKALEYDMADMGEDGDGLDDDDDDDDDEDDDDVGYAPPPKKGPKGGKAAPGGGGEGDCKNQ